MKDTVYIDAEDEITSVIDSVMNSKEKVVALVLPKKAEVFQSTINMKLLKKKAASAKKSVVLISSDEGLKTAAAAAGLHMAPTLKTKPEIPSAKKPEKKAEIVEASEIEEEKADASADTATSASSANAAIPSGDVPSEEVVDATPVTKKKRKLPKIPDFSSFRLRASLAAIVVVLLIVGWVFGFVILPKAEIIITADTRRVDVNGQFTLASDVNEFDGESNIVPAELAEVTKEDSATVPATGEKNIGEVASGSASFSAQICDSIGTPKDIESGAVLRSNGNVYRTQEQASFDFDSFDGSCLNFSTDNAAIAASEPGSAYNLANNSEFTVDGRSDVEASGSAKGGTDETAVVVSQADIDAATNQLTGAATAEASEELQALLREKGVTPLQQTLQETEPQSQRSANVDDEAGEVTVTRSVIYRMLGATNDDLDLLLDDLLRSDESILREDENIRDNGRDSAVLQVVSGEIPNRQTLSLQTVVVLGQTFNTEKIAEEVAGKKRGDIESELGQRDGVRDVSVEYSPVWVTTTPKSADKITVTILEADE